MRTPSPIPPPTRVLCVDDNADITAVVQMVIDTDPTMLCVGCLTSASDLIEAVRRLSPPPDVVLLDASMPGKNPLTVMTRMAAEFPAIRTIIYTGRNDPDFVDTAMHAGAWGYISKSDEPGAILRAVREVAAGKTWWPQPPRHG